MVQSDAGKALFALGDRADFLFTPLNDNTAPDPRRVIIRLAPDTYPASSLASLRAPGSTHHTIFKLDRTAYTYLACQEHQLGGGNPRSSRLEYVDIETRVYGEFITI
jgi:hypothetical protein